MEYENLRLNKSGSLELGTIQNKEETKEAEEEIYSVIDCDHVESNISKAGTSSAQQRPAGPESNKLADKVIATCSKSTDKQDDEIGKTNNRTFKDSSHQRSNTKATIMFIVGIVLGGATSSAITVFVKDMKSSEQDGIQINSCTEPNIQTEMSSSNDCNGSVFTLIANDTTAILMPPGYPFSHANNLSCSWLIDSGIDEQPIAISLDYYNMNCSFGDSLSVYDGSSTSDLTLVNSICGRNNVTQVYVSSDRNVLVTFTTDLAKQGQGFQLTYVNIPDKLLKHCNGSAFPLSSSKTTGTLISPGYPFSYANNLSCSWLIDSGIDEQPIAISLDVYNMNCSFGDSLSVYDGSSTSDLTLVDSVCGRNNVRQVYVSSDRYVLVTFTTDGTNQGQGFQLSYGNIPDKLLKHCNGSAFPLSSSKTTGTLISPGYPFSYANNLSCSWIIDSGIDEQPIAISLDYYNMNCSFGDSLSVYDGSSTSDLPLVNSVCGRHNVRQVYVSSNRNVLVTFTTDGTNQGQGFQLTYVNIPDKSLNYCDSSTLQLRASDTIDVLVSPGYPFSYANNLSCSWLIDSRFDGKSIAISLDYYNMNCSFGDSLSVYDGSTTTNLTLVNSVCGINNATQQYVSSGRYVLVTFTTDGAKQGQGFQLSYVKFPDKSLNHCGSSTLPLRAGHTQQVLVSPGYPFSYANNLACRWLIDSGTGGLLIAISLDFYNMDCSFGDSLSVYDGSTTTNLTLVNSVCGINNATQQYVSSGRYVLVTFTTDGAKQGQGFQLSYVKFPDKSLNHCGSSTLPLRAGHTQQVLVSPGYPFSYANNLACRWLIDSGTGGLSIAISLDYYNMDCSFGDSLSVYDGSSTSDFTLVNSACGINNATQLYISSGRNVLVTFTTDSANQGQGFQLTYVNIPDKSSYTCPVSPTPVNASETPGKLTSPGYPYITLLANYLSCTWLIDSGVDGQPIVLSYIEVCKMELPYGQKINIYDGLTTSKSVIFERNCKPGLNGLYGPYVTTDRYALVSFETLSANRGDGFQLSYLSVPDTSATGCTSTYTLTASTNIQYLTSDGFPSKYSDNSDCSWLISANSLSTISIAIVWSDIELSSTCSYDYLTFYNGDSTTDTLLMTKYCVKVTGPDVTPTTFTSSSTNVLVVFKSDSSETYGGFIIKYSVTMEIS